MAGAQELDYAAEGEKLLALVGLQGAGAPERYAPANPIWKHPETGALLYVGNAGIASDARALASLGITRVVYCQEADGKCHFEKDPSFVYLKFPIGLWRRERALSSPSDAAVRARAHRPATSLPTLNLLLFLAHRCSRTSRRSSASSRSSSARGAPC